MSIETLKCPECGAPLSSWKGITRCPYCGAILHVRLDEAKDTPAVESEKAVPPVEEPLAGKNESNGEISALAAASLAEELAARVRDGQEIDAIRRYRARTGEGLVDSKNAVERLAKNAADPQILEKLRSGSRAAEQEALHGQALADAVHALMGEGDKIGAIKLYRQVTGVGLAEAKAAVEGLDASRPAQRLPEQGVAPSALESSVRTLLVEGKKLEAIKLYREKTLAGFQEAKQAVESIGLGLPVEMQQKLKQPDSLRQRVMNPTCFIILFAVILLAMVVTFVILTAR